MSPDIARQAWQAWQPGQRAWGRGPGRELAVVIRRIDGQINVDRSTQMGDGVLGQAGGRGGREQSGTGNNVCSVSDKPGLAVVGCGVVV